MGTRMQKAILNKSNNSCMATYLLFPKPPKSVAHDMQDSAGEAR